MTENISCLSHLTMLFFTAIELWFNHMGHATSCKEVLRLQKGAVSIMTSSGHLDPIRPLFYKFGTMTVYDQSVLAYEKDKLDSFTAREDV